MCDFTDAELLAQTRGLLSDANDRIAELEGELEEREDDRRLAWAALHLDMRKSVNCNMDGKNWMFRDPVNGGWRRFNPVDISDDDRAIIDAIVSKTE